MSFFSSAFGMGLGGLGQGMAELGNKYIDEALAEQRAQVIADIQRQSRVKEAKELDEYNLSEPRQARVRAAAADAARSTAAVNLELDRIRANDPELRQGAIDTATAVSTAGAEAKEKVERKAIIERGLDPEFLKAQRALKLAEKMPESAHSLALAGLAKAQMTAIQNLEAIRTELSKAVEAGDKELEEKLREKLSIFETKPGKADRLRTAIEGAEKTIQSALKIVNDPLVTDAARKEAEESMRQARLRIEKYSSDLGLDTRPPKVSEADAHAQALKAIAAGAPRASVNAKLKAMGLTELPDPAKQREDERMRKRLSEIGAVTNTGMLSTLPKPPEPLSFRAQQELRRRQQEEADRASYGVGLSPALDAALRGGR